MMMDEAIASMAGHDMLATISALRASRGATIRRGRHGHTLEASLSSSQALLASAPPGWRYPTREISVPRCDAALRFAMPRRRSNARRGREPLRRRSRFAGHERCDVHSYTSRLASENIHAPLQARCRPESTSLEIGALKATMRPAGRTAKRFHAVAVTDMPQLSLSLPMRRNARNFTSPYRSLLGA